jgi:hypothetical protein
LSNSKSYLRWSINGELGELCELNQLTFEELREYERCADRFPQELPRAAADLAKRVESYRKLTESLARDVWLYLSLTEAESQQSKEV